METGTCVNSEEPKESQNVPAHQDMGMEFELPLIDETLKRKTKDSETRVEEDKKGKKKRRSSFYSNKRRSIVGGTPVLRDKDELASETDKPSGASQSSTESDARQEQEVDGRLRANPENARMETLIQLMEEQIKRVDGEYEEWVDLRENFEKKEEESRIMTESSNLKLHASNLTDEVKALAEEYIGERPKPLLEVRNKILEMIGGIQFHREACCEDIRLVKHTSEALVNRNSLLEQNLQEAFNRQCADDDDGEMTYQSNKGRIDPKAAVYGYLNAI